MASTASLRLCGSPRRGDWIPASAGMTVGVRGSHSRELSPARTTCAARRGDWIPASAGMTVGVRGSHFTELSPARTTCAARRGDWIPAFAGMTVRVCGSHFTELSPGGTGWGTVPVARNPAFAGMTVWVVRLPLQRKVPRRDDLRRLAGDDIGCWSLQAAFVRREYTRAACTPTPLRSTASASKVPVNAIFFFISHLLRFWLRSNPALGVSRYGLPNAVWLGCSRFRSSLRRSRRSPLPSSGGRCINHRRLLLPSKHLQSMIRAAC